MHHDIVGLKLVEALGTDKMAQQIKVLASKQEDLSLIPGTHKVEAKNKLLRVVL